MRIVYRTTPTTCMSGKIKPECLPATGNTAFQHGRRVFQQCRERMLLDPDLTDTPFSWQWDRDRRMFLPVYSVHHQISGNQGARNFHFVSLSRILLPEHLLLLPEQCKMHPICLWALGNGHCSAEGNCQNLDAVQSQDVIASDGDDE